MIKNGMHYDNNLETIISTNSSELNKRVILEKGVKYIQKEAFYFSNIESIVFPESLKEIFHSAFAYCNNLKEVNIKQNVNLHKSAFYNCPDLKNIHVNSKYIPENCFAFTGSKNKNGINVELVNTFEIGSYAFRVSRIGNLSLPDTLEKIGFCAFEDCLFRNDKLVLPRSVKIIAENAFASTEGLNDIYLPDGIEDIGNLDDYDYHDMNIHMSKYLFKKLGLTMNRNIIIDDKTIDELLETMTFKEANKFNLENKEIKR